MAAAANVLPLVPPKARRSKSPVISYRPDYARFTGSPLCGLVLSQIAFYYTSADYGKAIKVRFGMTWWLARSYQEWADDLAMSYKQIRDAMDKLKELGVIETLSARDFKGAKVIHLRLLVAEGANTLVGYPEYLPEGANTVPSKADPLPYGADHLPSGANLKALEEQEEIEEQKNAAIAVVSGKVKTVQRPEKTHPEKKEEEIPEFVNCGKEEKKMRTAKSLAESMKTGASLEALWKTKMSESIGKMYRPLTLKERKQLNGLKDAYGDEEARAAIKAVFEDWEGFAKYVKEASGWKKVGDAPNLDGLCMNVDYAVQFAAKVMAPAQSIAQTVAPVSLPVVTKETLPVEEKPANVGASKPKGNKFSQLFQSLPSKE